MTDDELDQLASVYLDGEATPEEVALVERDPDLQARVAELRAVDVGGGAIPSVPSALMEAHLAAARQAFDQEITARSEGAAAVAAAQADPGPGPVAADGAGASPRRWWQVMPAWLPAAAVFVVVGGGFLLASNQGSDQEESFETAGDAIDASTDGGAEADRFVFDSATDGGDTTDQAANGAAVGDLNVGTGELSADDAAMEMGTLDGDEAADSDAMADSSDAVPGSEPTTDTRRADETDESEEDGSDADEAAEADEVAPVLILTSIPTSLDDLELPDLTDPSLSPCVDALAGDGVSLEGWTEAIVGEELVELWVVQRGLDLEPQPVVVAFDPTGASDTVCVIIEP